MKYGDLLDNNATETEIREFLTQGDVAPITFRIPRNLKDSSAEEAARRGMSFSAFVRMCLMNELAKRG